MPLEVGNTWTYQCNSGLMSRVATLKVDKQTAVGQVKGYSLTSEIGQTTMAWQGDRLIVGKLASSEFFPPLPIYSTGPQTVPWSGTVRTSGSAESAKATLKVTTAEETVEGKKITLNVGQVTLTTESGKHELTTWLRPGKGIYLQEHRVNDQLIARLRYISGP